MKITIGKEVNVQNALDEIKTFFTEHFSEYPILKSDLKVYLNLKDNKGDICPKNDKEYEMYADKFVDVIELAKSEAYFNIIKNLKDFLWNAIHNEKRILHDISVAENYIATAQEKGRKTENIEKRKNDLIKYSEKLEYAKKKVELYSLLVDLCNKNMVKILYVRINRRYNKYNSDIEYECILLFKDNGEIEGYFEYNKGFDKNIPAEYRKIF